MFKHFPGKTHTSILTQLGSFLAVFAFFYTTLITPVFAACLPSSGGGCITGGMTYTCSINGSVYCCPAASGPSECASLRTSGAAANTAPKGNGVLKVNPECNGGKGISTALGCIPVDTQGFTASLLGFLAGIVGLIALIVMIIATIMIMTGGSNPEQVKKGKELFTGGITGLFFIIFSVTILRIIAGDIIKLPGFN